MALELYLKKQQEIDDAVIEDEVLPNVGKVGDVKTSILTEAQFQTVHGTEWILMDGRDVTGSAYHTLTANTTVPDGRGIFLRGKNNGRSTAEGNPSGEVSMGTNQADQLQSFKVGDGTVRIQSRDSYPSAGLGATSGGVYGASVGGNKADIGPYHADGANGNPRLGNETRPKT